MARIVDPNTGGLSFESREDLSPEFDVVKPFGLRWDFELPREVDFFVALSRHRTEQDFAPVVSLLDGADLLLSEGVGEGIGYLETLLEEISEGSSHSLNYYIEDIAKGGFVIAQQAGFAIARAQALFDHRVAHRFLDPPYSHTASRASDFVAKNPSRIANGQALRALNMLGVQRDTWVLQNLKKIVDNAVKFEKGKRRKVVIARGFMHLRLLRALEHKCEYVPKKAKGSQVVISTINIPHDKNGMSVELFEAIVN